MDRTHVLALNHFFSVGALHCQLPPRISSKPESLIHLAHMPN
jgi:hypothetical protein